MDSYSGNANEAPPGDRGWFVGRFIGKEDDLRHSDSIEIKWGAHAPGDRRAEWTQNQATTITILVRGRMRIQLPDREHLLEKEGDYVMWAPGVIHRWVVEDHTLILTIRWPSEGSRRAPEP